jgi:hypothetical protein
MHVITRFRHHPPNSIPMCRSYQPAGRVGDNCLTAFNWMCRRHLSCQSRPISATHQIAVLFVACGRSGTHRRRQIACLMRRTPCMIGDIARHTSTLNQGHASKITTSTSAQTAEQLPEESKHVHSRQVRPECSIMAQAAHVFTEGRLRVLHVEHIMCRTCSPVPATRCSIPLVLRKSVVNTRRILQLFDCSAGHLAGCETRLQWVKADWKLLHGAAHPDNDGAQAADGPQQRRYGAVRYAYPARPPVPPAAPYETSFGNTLAQHRVWQCDGGPA